MLAQALDKSTRRVLAWFVHIFTASGAVLALFAIHGIIQEDYKLVMWIMMLTILIDGCDGTLARLCKVKEVMPEFDGALLDNIIDFLTYVFVSACFLLIGPLLELKWRIVCASIILLTSAFQFCQSDAKTQDHFFKGFPSYWNVLIIYLYYWQTSHQFNLFMILWLGAMVFVPIKYIYPSRLDYVTKDMKWRIAFIIATVTWGLATAGMIWSYPARNQICEVISLTYVGLYLILSLYRTFNPLEP